MNKTALRIMMLCSLFITSCSGTAGISPELPPEQVEPDVPKHDDQSDTPQAYTSLINKTYPAPDAYLQEPQHRGEIVRIDYDTRDYAEGTGETRSNAAYVYLPYGYDMDNGLPTANYTDADPYCKAMPKELVNDLIPIVESRYRTYAGSTDTAGLEGSRSHRAIGGFSMGAVTTWYALEQTLPYFKYFMPVSGDCWSLGRFAGMNRPDETAAYLADIVRQSAQADDFHIWAASGTADSAYSETLLQVRGMAQLTDIFGLNHLTFHEKDGAQHDYRPIPEYVYNALPFFFPTQNSAGGSATEAAN